MKAKVLLTGEIVDVEFFEQRGTAMTNVYIEIEVGRTFYEYELEFITEQLLDDISKELLDKQNHWQDVRERAAIAAMQSILTSDVFRDAKIDAARNIGELPEEEIAATSIRFADELVKQLRGE